MSFEKGEMYDWIDIENQANANKAKIEEHGMLDLTSRPGETFVVVKNMNYTASFVLVCRDTVVYECIMFINKR